MSTYTPIASQTLSSAAASVTFSGIPQTYTDLVVVFAGSITTGFDAINMQFNGDTGTTYSRTVLTGNGSNATSSRDSNATSMQIGIMGTEQSSSIWNVMNYANTTTNKTVLSRGNSSANSVRANVGLWRNTAAITSITITAASSTFISGSTFNLYGIASGGPKAFGGDTVTTDGTYYYHTFRSSGTFTPTQALSNVDYLVVAGGGSGGNNAAGGGGAGGLRCTVGATGGGGSLESKLSLSAQAYTVTVGAGAAINPTANGNGISGSNSVFATVTSNGGSGGMGALGVAVPQGGSGGGAYFNGGTPGTGTTGQGFAGGGGGYGPPSGSGGGGGAGAVGSDRSGVRNGGAGGTGVATSISGSSTTYAGCLLYTSDAADD